MEERKLNVIRKSCEMYAKFGIKSVSMDDIAKACAISKKTLYELVSDKRELVKLVIEQELNDKNTVCAFDKEEKNAMETLFLVYNSALEFFKDFNLSMEYDLEKYYPDLYKKTKLNRRKQMYHNLEENMIQGRKEGLYRDNFNIDIVIKLHTVKVESLLKTNIFNDDDHSINDIIKEMFLYHFYAIATTKGRQILDEEIKKQEAELSK